MTKMAMINEMVEAEYLICMDNNKEALKKYVNKKYLKEQIEEKYKVFQKWVDNSTHWWYNKGTNKKGENKMETIMIEWGATTTELLMEAGLTPEEVAEALADE